SKIHDLYPDKWIPLYSMVTFQDTMRYSEALSLGKKQEKIMLQLMKDPHLKYDWESRDYADVIRQLDSTEN
ncbi:MAG: kynurenine 3-monooxygenase, partial [Cyclobacteriaceae bacterium]|nr:kynurenine 3-monooxygenase [Cyclobacteriaceae bacterium]